MELLEQCRLWHEEGEHEKIARALEALPEAQRTAATDMELARAYNNLAQPDEPEGRELLRRAVALMLPHEQDCPDPYSWNFRMGYACYYLDREGEALGYLERALELHPGDAPDRNTQKEIRELIEDCRRRLTLPRFERTFRRRAGDAWAAFARQEAELRRLMDLCEAEAVVKLFDLCAAALHRAFNDVAFAFVRSGQRYRLVLSPQGNWARLFELAYFARLAPAALAEHWDVLVGAQPGGEPVVLLDGQRLDCGDARVQVCRRDERMVTLSLYCPALADVDRDRAARPLADLLDMTLGELPRMRTVAACAVADGPLEDSVPLGELPAALEEMGFDLSLDPAVCLENCYASYRMEPNEDPDADWRLDVVAGSTRCAPLVRQYLQGESAAVDLLHGDGAAAGFLCWPLDGFSPEERGGRAFALRDALERALAEKAGDVALTLLGGATGLFCGYLDLIAWDLPAVLDAAADFFAASGLDWASFHSFRRDVGTVRLWNAQEEAEVPVHPETGSLLSPEDIKTMEGWLEGSSGYFYQVLQYLTDFMEKGEKEGRFTERQARRDLQIALWYAYACLNVDEYEYYYRAAMWMPASEPAAKGCGTWYYRYAAALMYCGRLEEALRYAEQGTAEQPDYPWAWLLTAKLRSHFGDREGALAAVERGLALVPEDYEFLTLRREIGEGASLEQMEYHWIDPQCDRQLQAGLDRDADDKQRAISCITLNEAGLANFRALFQPDPADYVPNAPYCAFHRQVGDRQVEVVFLMNEAGLSKLDPAWLAAQRDRLDSGCWLTAADPDGAPGRLDAVLLGLDYSVRLVYRARGRASGRFQTTLDEEGAPGPCEWLERRAPEEEEQPEETEPKWVYTSRQMELLEEHIRMHIGPFEQVLHELVSPDIHVDLCVVPPDGDRDYYTLVTMGMGARRMNVPAELAEHRLERAELAIALPPGWKLDEESLKDERWYWPLRLLKSLARLPGACDTWLGWGHTVDNQEPFAGNTDLCATMLVGLQGALPGGEVCPLPGGEEINFYQIIPLYRAEMEYKQQNGAEALLDHMGGVSFVVRPDRPCAALDEAAEKDFLMDDAEWHLRCIREKQLPVEKLAAYAHMALYLRWCLERGLMGEAFLQEHAALAEVLRQGSEGADLRLFVRDALGGRLWSGLFNEEGMAFAAYYYGEGEAPSFPSDVDDWSLGYFGPRRYQSDEFQDEAYLFVPFDEAYYQGIKGVMDRRFAGWQKQGDPRTDPSGEALALMERMGFPCLYFPAMEDPDPLLAAFGYGRRQAIRDGYIPLLLAVEDGVWDDLRRLPAPGARPQGEAGQTFASLWDADGARTRPMLLVKVPAAAPWEVFERLPLGGDGPRLAAAAREWYEAYGAVPSAAGGGMVEFTLPDALPDGASPRERLAECLFARRAVWLA